MAFVFVSAFLLDLDLDELDAEEACKISPLLLILMFLTCLSSDGLPNFN